MNKFKIGDPVKIVADEERLKSIDINQPLTGKTGIINVASDDSNPLSYRVEFDINYGGRWFDEQDLELAEQEQPAHTFVGHPGGGLEVKNNDPNQDNIQNENTIRTFDTGATRDTIQGKLDYVKALSPIVIRRYVQYLDKHRLQPDGSYRDFDNWKKGIPQETYHSSGGRHFFDTWLLTEGYATEDNHGPVEIEDTLCAQLFNVMGRLHEILKKKELRALPSRTIPVEGGY